MNRFYFLFGVLSCCLLGFDLLAQNKKSPYERLLETQQEYEAAMKKGDSLEVAEICYLMGKRYSSLRNFTKAQEWFLRSLRIREPLGPSEDIGKTYFQMAGFQTYLPNAAQSLRYNYLAYINFRAGKSPRSQMQAYKLLSHLHVETWKLGQSLPYSKSIGALDSALYYAEQCLQMAKIVNTPVDIGTTYAYLSNIWKLKNNLHKSKEYRQKELEIFTEAKLVNNLMAVYMDTAEELLKQNNPTLAKPWLKKALDLTSSISDYNLNENLNEVYALYYEQTGQWEKAFRYQKKGLELKNREFESQINQAIQNLTLLDEHEKKKAEFIARQKEMALQNKLAIVVFILFLVAVIAGGLFYLLFAKYKKISRENAELVKEQSHRTKNNLQSVSDLLSLELHRLSDPVAVKAMEESLMRVEAMLLLHRGLYQGEKLIEVNLPKYLPDLVKSVLRSYHLEAVKVQYDIEPIWLHTDKAIPLGLIVNELTTNTCKYALKNNPDPQLTLHCFLQTDRLFLRFADNGPGFVSPADKNTFGLRLIGLLMNKLKAKGDFSTANGCCFELSFLTKAAPLNQPKSLKNQPV